MGAMDLCRKFFHFFEDFPFYPMIFQDGDVALEMDG